MTVVIPTLIRDPDSLVRSVESVLDLASTSVVVVIDAYGPAAVPGPIERHVRVLRTGGGAGFATAAQLGVGACDSALVAFLNDDAWFEAGALEALSSSLRDRSDVAGLAPKVRLAGRPELINSVGTVLFGDGRADSRGIGQPDLGQYDRSETVFGLHFAAAIVRRELFADGAVGPLDTWFGTYYEDVDWCLRANVLGYRFASLPEAVALHEHSATAATLGSAFSFAHQQRNLVWTALKSFELPRATSIAVRRAGGLTRRRLTQGGPWVVPSVAAGLPRVWSQRRTIQARRVVPDRDILALSAGERIWFDPGTGPLLGAECLMDALSRLDPPLARELGRCVRSEGDVEDVLRRAPAAARRYWADISQRIAPGT